MAKTLAEVAKTLNIRESTIQNPIKKIFLCGGQRAKKVGEPPISLRGKLIALLEDADGRLPPYIVLAEEAVAWYHSLSSNRFSNLVELEACIAALSTQILLIVESAGSMTELGAFSFDNRLSKKLYAVLDKSYEKDQSFIMDGPIAKIRNLGGYCGRDWLLRPKESEIDAVKAEVVSQRIITEILNPEINRPPKKQDFDDQSTGHKMLLISDLVCLGGALREPEIFTFVKALGISITRFELGQYLFLLEKLKFLSETHEGMDDYFFQTDPNLKFVAYATSDGRQFDRDRYRAYIQEALPKRGHYEDRKNVLKAAKQKVQA
jgi:hypothetical protein